jgi:ABC-type uncharacterized transport system substrate-binding protein
MIASEAHAGLTREAELAAAQSLVEMRSATSSSDRETLYLFRRLATEIDGLWLIPDQQILSPAVLRELFAYAASYGVGVSVSSDALLTLGALLSASSRTTNIAETVDRVLDRMIDADVDDVPVLTPLSEVEIDVNEEVAERLGLTPREQRSRTTRD